MPASNARAIEKARSIAADVIILDLEDAVSPDQKDMARKAAIAALAEGGFGRREMVLRVNALDTPWGADDLAAAVSSGADAVLVPKVSGVDDVHAYDRALAAAPQHLALWTMIETSGAIMQLGAMAALSSGTRLGGWVIGPNDLVKEMRARPSQDRAAILPLLTLAIAAARYGGLAILDGVCNDFRDLDRFACEAAQGRAMGFDGKTLIHPAQVEPCNRAFSPDEAEIAWAKKVVAAFDIAGEGAGAQSARQIDGQMVEWLHREDAVRLLEAVDEGGPT
jgi:citrate lyase subunit beta/citryl-CoA lyase